MITFRKGRRDDLPVIMDLIDESREVMRANGNRNQWVEGYPAQSTIEQDIDLGHCIVGEEDSQLVTSFAFLPGPEPTYARIYEGKWLDDDPYYVVHRLASRADRRGVFAAVMAYCREVTHNLRVDTHRDNTIMRHCLAKAGFTYCGIIYLTNGDERLAYQKRW